MIFLHLWFILMICHINKTAGENENGGSPTTGSHLCGENKWRCDDGTCIWAQYKCNYIDDCPDGSDEKQELCPRDKPCVVPPHPQHGNFTLPGQRVYQPGSTITNKQVLILTCDDGYAVTNNDYVYCDNGVWSSAFPECSPACELVADISLKYYCLEPDAYRETRLCQRFEPYGTVVKPVCQRPHYYSSHELPLMQCIDGNWDYIAKCKPECGLVSEITTKPYNGAPASYGEIPWQAAIYLTDVTPYKLICSGTLISENVVISAAQCFWSELDVKNPESIVVSLGNLYKPWKNEEFEDTYQKFNVTSIEIPVRFRGDATKYQDDIAIVVLEFSVEFNSFVRPVCLDFDIAFDRWQLVDGNEGKSAGWGMATEYGSHSPLLLGLNMEYVDIADCIDNAPQFFKPYITSDKICSNSKGQGLCRGDVGSGLVFPETDFRGRTRYYLRGVSAMPPKFNLSCSSYLGLSVYTKISKHMDFIIDFVNWAGGNQNKV